MGDQVEVFGAGELPERYEQSVRDFARTHWTYLFSHETRSLPGLWWLRDLDPVHVVAVHEGIVAGYAAVVRKELEHAGARFTTLGLHGVFVYPDFRGEGVGARLVDVATGLVRASADADVAILFCPPELVGFYGTAGWEQDTRAVTLVGPAEAPQRVERDAEMPEVRMMLFCSGRGSRARREFWERPLYFGGSGW